MVASSQPLASMVGLDVLKRGGNAVDASIAMAAVLNVTEPNMTGVGGDAFMMIDTAKTKTLEGLNASGRAPLALSLDYFTSRTIAQMPTTGMEPVTVPGAFDGWVTLLDKHGTMKLAELWPAPAIDYAENGFAVMEKTAADWVAETPRLKLTPAAAATYVVNGDAPKPGAIFYQKNLARTLRTLARGGREAFYRGEIARAIVDYCRKNGGFLSMDDFAAHKSEWVGPMSTTYRGHTLHELPPNGQGLTALLLANILDGIDLASLRTRPAPLLPHADRSDQGRVRRSQKSVHRRSSVREGAGEGAAVKGLRRRPPPADRSRRRRSTCLVYGDLRLGSDTTYFTVVDKDRNAVSFINSIFSAFGSALVAGETGIVLQNRGAGFSAELGHPNRIEPGSATVYSLIPAMVFKDGQLLVAYGVMGGDVQAQGTPAGAGQPDRSRTQPAAGDRRAARPLHQRPRRHDGRRADRAGDQ